VPVRHRRVMTWREQTTDLAALHRERYAPMVRLAHLLTGSNAVAEELVQDAFVRVGRRWDSITGEPAPYLRAAVVNACRSHLRRLVAERRAATRHAATAVDGHMTDPAGRELLDALARLPYRQRAALVLRFYDDRSEAEIADILRCRPGTVKSSISRGLAALREVIER
jgi:RNA polymerase sigma-70 factor (sigma-E family)